MFQLQFIGKISPPPPLAGIGALPGLAGLFSLILKLLFLVAGLYVFLQFILAGYRIITSGADPKALALARDKIIWSLIGLVIVLGSFAFIILVEQMSGLCLGFSCKLSLTVP